MAVKLRSELQQETEGAVTRHASSQVMSLIRAQRSTDVACGVDNQEEVSTNPDEAAQRLAESVEFARTFEESGQVTDRADAVLSHDEAELLVRSLAGIPGGRPLIRVLLEGIDRRARTVAGESLEISPLQPPSEPDSNGSSHGDCTDPDEPRRGDAMLENNFPGGRYDDRELAEYTKALRNSAPITLPKLHSKGDYKAWKSEVPLHFEPRTLGDITYGGERYDEDLGLRRQKYAEWYSARKTKAFSALALSLSVDLRSTFKVDELRDDMEAASVLWEAITKHFEASDGINSDYLLRELMMRMLQPNEKVDAYAEDIELKVTKLRQAKGDFADWQQASLLLSSSVRVFPDLTREYANWLNSHDRKTLKLTTVLQRLRAAEHQRQQLESQSQPASRATAQVAHVTSEHQDKGRKRSKQQRKRNKGVQDKKARTNCGNCGGDGHWWLECTETTGKPLKPELERRKKDRAQGRQPPASLVNSVRVVQVAQDDGQSRGLFAGLSLTS
uniref:CCHC-type domain-containing protein n=1 Tax=Phytophthora fragariae TaxID=53985 RepID=A0A6A3F044_9STRA|nr:hypothetical protein PF009_g11200 [Phytophthora fragariae]